MSDATSPIDARPFVPAHDLRIAASRGLGWSAQSYRTGDEYIMRQLANRADSLWGRQRRKWDAAREQEIDRLQSEYRRLRVRLVEAGLFE